MISKNAFFKKRLKQKEKDWVLMMIMMNMDRDMKS